MVQDSYQVLIISLIMLRAYYNCDLTMIRLQFGCDSTTTEVIKITIGLRSMQFDYQFDCVTDSGHVS